jgi:uncharacterized protein YbjT (DUF2867 family)
MDDLIAVQASATLTMPSFMDNILRFAEPIRNGGVFFSRRSPATASRRACATCDIAATAARPCSTTHGRRHHVAVLGPEDISHNDMAELISEVLGKPVVSSRSSARRNSGCSKPEYRRDGPDHRHVPPRTAASTTPNPDPESTT